MLILARPPIDAPPSSSQNDGADSTAARLGRGVLNVVPMTANVQRIYPFQVLVRAKDSGLDRDSKAQAEQVRPVSVDRIGSQIGTIPRPLMLEVDEPLRLHLEL